MVLHRLQMRINADENTPDPMKGAKFIEFKNKIKKFDFLNNVRFASTKGVYFVCFD